MADDRMGQENPTLIRERISIETVTTPSGDVCVKNDPKHQTSLEELPAAQTKEDTVARFGPEDLTVEGEEYDVPPYTQEAMRKDSKEYGVPSYILDGMKAADYDGPRYTIVNMKAEYKNYDIPNYGPEDLEVEDDPNYVQEDMEEDSKECGIPSYVIDNMNTENNEYDVPNYDPEDLKSENDLETDTPEEFKDEHEKDILPNYAQEHVKSEAKTSTVPKHNPTDLTTKSKENALKDLTNDAKNNTVSSDVIEAKAKRDSKYTDVAEILRAELLKDALNKDVSNRVTTEIEEDDFDTDDNKEIQNDAAYVNVEENVSDVSPKLQINEECGNRVIYIPVSDVVNSYVKVSPELESIRGYEIDPDKVNNVLQVDESDSEDEETPSGPMEEIPLRQLEVTAETSATSSALAEIPSAMESKPRRSRRERFMAKLFLGLAYKKEVKQIRFMSTPVKSSSDAENRYTQSTKATIAQSSSPSNIKNGETKPPKSIGKKNLMRKLLTGRTDSRERASSSSKFTINDGNHLSQSREMVPPTTKKEESTSFFGPSRFRMFNTLSRRSSSMGPTTNEAFRKASKKKSDNWFEMVDGRLYPSAKSTSNTHVNNPPPDT